jgi:signal transduction histidine kinase
MTAVFDEPLLPAPAVRILRRLGIDTQYVLLGMPLAVVTLVLCVVGFALGLGLLAVVVGFPVLVVALFVARGCAVLERARLAPVLGRRLPHPQYKRITGRTGFWRRVLAPLSDGQAWLDLLHGILRILPSTVAFVFVVVWWAGTLTGLSYPLYDWALPHPPDNVELPELLGLVDTASSRIAVNMAIGAVFAVTLYPVVRASALLEAQFARFMLGGLTDLREQVARAEWARDTARAQRSAAVSAEATALRRLERDIHDGPQQRLVRLAMDLGRAEQQFDTDPTAARTAVAEALAQAREALDELRALSRGIAPPILVDRGLTAALVALAGRCTVEVQLDAPELGRREPAVESTAYFVVAEALTNVAKHSRATACRVVVAAMPGGLLVTVQDDGVGGADIAKGHGLAGLSDRVQAAGGVLGIDSRDGAGTTVTAALPG